MVTLLEQTLRKHQITILLGEGGMGAVYKATKLHLERAVATKVLSNNRNRIYIGLSRGDDPFDLQPLPQDLPGD